MRIGELLKAFPSHPVESYLIEFVANQTDWRKRLRELRYLGWKINWNRRRAEGGRTEVAYALNESAAWPADPARVVRESARERARRNRAKRTLKR